MPLQINCKLQSASELNIQIISVLTEPSRLNNGIRKKFTIENSIYHGIKELDSGGFISVSVHRETDCIIFVIEDNGPGMSGQSAAVLAQPPSGHFGIKNIQRRIRMYYGENGSMSMENTVPARYIRI